jgi:hypothetical protein
MSIQRRKVHFFPSPNSRSKQWQSNEALMLRKLSELADAPELSIPASFGYQTRTAYELLAKTEGHVANKSSPRHEHMGPSLRRFFLRPSPEPIVFSYLSLVREGDASLDRVGLLASSLFGSNLEVRSNDSSSAGLIGIPTAYIDAENVRECWAIRANRTKENGALAWAIQRFLDASQIHPFHDGNGRLARALFLIDLVRIFGNAGLAMLPIGPFVYLSSSDIRRSYGRIDDIGDDESFFECISDVILNTCEYVLSQRT